MSITAGLADRSATAQSGGDATFAITRRAALSRSIWPADFNGDGITDLAASAPRESFQPPTPVQVALGDGRGGFGAPIPTSVLGDVLGTGDFNGDGRIDIIAVDAASAQLVLLPGNGNGTFANARAVTTIAPGDDEAAPFALSGDLNGDGKRDLIAAGQIFPGRGDFTFASPIRLQFGVFPGDGILVDVNGDGRKDILVANRFSATVSVLLNQGNFSFAASELMAAYQTTDVTAADLNGDGKVDIVFSAMLSTDDQFNTGEGKVGVMVGRGDGTFAPAFFYRVERGAWQVVVGDFTRDGIIDIATANRSSRYHDDCGDPRKTWDSVTVLPGRGDGSFGAPRSFSIGDQSDTASERFKNKVITLNTSDLNGDRQTDLIASNGVILLNIQPRANRAPIVDAGPDLTAFDSQVLVRAGAVDPDEDLLLWKWTDSIGRVVATWPTFCGLNLHQGRNVLTVTVDDQHGHVASDSMTITVDWGGDGGVAVAGAPVDDNWRHKDVGGVGVAGSVTYSNGTFTVTGSGADIWNGADEFQYVYQPGGANFDSDVVVHVDSVENVSRWTKAGLMLRQSLDAGSPHASLFVTPEKGIAFQYRSALNGTSVTVPGPLWTAPVWLRLSVRQSFVKAYYRRNASDQWTKIDEREFPSIGNLWAYSGLAVTSHLDGTRATAVFSNLSTRAFPVWTTALVGTSIGSASLDGRNARLTNRGSDIWNTADQFTFLNTSWDAEGRIEAEVDEVDNTHAWAKAGLMFREKLDVGSRNVAIVVTPGRGISFQYRTETGALSELVTPQPGAAPVVLRLTRVGDTFTGYWSTAPNVTGWNALGSIQIPMPPEIRVGLVLTSHNAGATAAASLSELLLMR